jgi:hypothetical protein
MLAGAPERVCWRLSCLLYIRPSFAPLHGLTDRLWRACLATLRQKMFNVSCHSV